MIVIDHRTRVVASPSSWIEGEAQRQLVATSALAGMRWAVGLPDLHPGKGHPVGVSALADGVVCPHLVGGDLGCGMGLWRTDLDARTAKPDRLARDSAGSRVRGTATPRRGSKSEASINAPCSTRWARSAVVTISQRFRRSTRSRTPSLSPPSASASRRSSSWSTVVHAGSGESILRAHVAVHGAKPVEAGSEQGCAYLRAHDLAVGWAKANRALIAHRIAMALGAELVPVLDVCHNAVTPREGGWLHRKGAAPHDAGVVPIPGSRGALTYLVEPMGDGVASGHSLAHGAGRKWTRNDARARMRERFRAADLVRTSLGGVVVCEDKDLLFEEAPPAYKRIDRVVGDLVEAGACRVVATLRPVVTYKNRDEER